MQELDQSHLRRKAAASTMARLSQLHHRCGADGIDQGFQIAEVFIRRVDRADRNRVLLDPLLKLVCRLGQRAGAEGAQCKCQ